MKDYQIDSLKKQLEDIKKTIKKYLKECERMKVQPVSATETIQLIKDIYADYYRLTGKSMDTDPELASLLNMYMGREPITIE